MKEFNIKQWATSKTPIEKFEDWKPNTGALLEYRYFTVQPIRIVEQWGYTPEKKGDL